MPINIKTFSRHARRSITAAILIGAAATTSAATAAGLDLSRLPRDSRYFMHLDAEALAESGIASSLSNLNPQITGGVQRYIAAQSGIDLAGITSVTIYGSEYEADAQTILVTGQLDRPAIESKMTSDESTMITQWKDQTFYSVTARKPGEDNDKTFTVAFVDDQTLVVTPDIESMRQAMALVGDDGDSLKGSDSPLTQKPPEGTILHGAAFDLNDLRQYAPLMPVLRQHKKICFAFGAKDDGLFKETRLEGASEDVAVQTEAIVRGVLAYEKLWAADSETMMEVLDKAQISRDGKTVMIDWTGSGYNTVDALQQAITRLQIMKMQMSQQ